MTSQLGQYYNRYDLGLKSARAALVAWKQFLVDMIININFILMYI